MNIKNTMCRLSELTQEQRDSLVKAMPKSDLCDFSTGVPLIGVTRCGTWGTWSGFERPTIVSYTEMMQLLGKTMKVFTKSDLKAGVHFVKDRDGVFYAVCRNTFCGLNRFVRLSYFKDELVNIKENPELDIMEVYETDGDRSMTSYLKGLGLRRIWERKEQTEAQKEMEALQTQIDKGAAYMAELHEQAKRLQAKL
jgi:hypothetical protein